MSTHCRCEHNWTLQLKTRRHSLSRFLSLRPSSLTACMFLLQVHTQQRTGHPYMRPIHQLHALNVQFPKNAFGERQCVVAAATPLCRDRLDTRRLPSSKEYERQHEWVTFHSLPFSLDFSPCLPLSSSSLCWTFSYSYVRSPLSIPNSLKEKERTAVRAVPSRHQPNPHWL